MVWRVHLVSRDNLMGLLHRIPSTLPHQHERETTTRDQRQHDDDANDMRGETFPFLSLTRSRENHLCSKSFMDGVLATKHSANFIPSCEEFQYSTKGLLTNPPLDVAPVLHFSLPGYSCLPHLWVWRVSSIISSQMSGPKWLTSSPTAHHTPPFHTSIPHECLTSHNLTQRNHDVFVQTFQTRNNTHM